MKGKKVLLFPVFLLLIFALINFVPLKYAKSKNTLQDNAGELSDFLYVCEYTQITAGNWVAEKESNLSISDSIIFLIENENEVFRYLSDEFKTEYIEPTGNKFIFEGVLRSEEFPDGRIQNFLTVYKWDIVYPIRRKSLRGLVSPKSYLTVFDFDWISYLKNELIKNTILP